MIHVHLNDAAEQNIYYAPLLEALCVPEKQRQRIYTIKVKTGGLSPRSYTFATTSKDLFLALGSIGEDARMAMANLFDFEFDYHRPDGESMLLFSFSRPGEEQAQRRGFLVTCAKSDLTSKEFHLARAN